MKKERIHIDMDHCAVDFEKGKRNWLATFPDENYPHSHMEFWINLEPMPGFLESLRHLEKKYDVFLLTAPSIRNRACWTGKAIWVFNNLGPAYLEKLIISYDKSQFSGAYLIDDGNQNGQNKYNGQHIRFAHSNEFSSWPAVVRYIELQKIHNSSSSIPSHFMQDAQSFIEEKLKTIDSSNVFQLKKTLEESMGWVFKQMKISNPPEEKEN